MKGFTFKQVFLDCFRKFFSLVIFLFLIAAFVETFITPLLIAELDPDSGCKFECRDQGYSKGFCSDSCTETIINSSYCNTDCCCLQGDYGD